eukprot:362384-Chlamydomonas_euryale.AAC.4
MPAEPDSLTPMPAEPDSLTPMPAELFRQAWRHSVHIRTRIPDLNECMCRKRGGRPEKPASGAETRQIRTTEGESEKLCSINVRPGTIAHVESCSDEPCVEDFNLDEPFFL